MYNILICDDEKDIVNALKIYLNDSNYHFLEAFDGEEDSTVGNDSQNSLLYQEGQPFVVGIGIDIVVQKSPVDPVHGVTAPLIERIIEAVRTHTEYLKQESLFSVSKNRDLP